MNLYPPSPQDIPADLTRPTKKFKQKVGIAILGLILFVGIYMGLMIWFGWTSYHLFSALKTNPKTPLLYVIMGVFTGILSLFMLKSLFNLKREKRPEFITVTEKEEPELVRFIYRLADEIGAPRPHKIILTDRVNASVFYDLNILNLFFPSKKNLEIGVGLVNTTNLSEFKAILAHEFGHFAQRSMLLGRYVYIFHQIAQRIVSKRDALDRVLAGISSVDIRIAWIGWILSILVWAMRSLIEVLFTIVILAERALSREMEFQADLVSVSVTGSDPLINGLHRLRGSDEAYQEMINLVNRFMAKGYRVPDMYALQSNYIERMQRVQNDPSYGGEPEEFKDGKKMTVFASDGYAPPVMWSTHPPDEEREENAKRTYIPVRIDRNSTWQLFEDEKKTKRKLTDWLYGTVEKMPECQDLSEEEAIERMNTLLFDWKFLDPKYQGLYMKRTSTVFFGSYEEMYTGATDSEREKVLSEIYQEDVKKAVEELELKQKESDQLTAYQMEGRTAQRRKIMFRGRRIKRRQIKVFLKELKEEIKEINDNLAKHDQKCRSFFHRLAKTKGPEIAELHESLCRLLFYTETTSYGLTHLHARYQASLQVAGMGNATHEQIIDLVRDANRVGSLLEKVYEDSRGIDASGLAYKAYAEKPYSEQLEPYRLGDADRNNLNGWIQHFPGWFDLGATALWELRNATLGRLIALEEELATSHGSTVASDWKETKLGLPEDLKGMKCGNEPEIVFKPNLWDRFLGGTGLVPMVLKFTIAAGIIGSVIWMSNLKEEYNMYVYNGFDTTLSLDLNGSETKLPPLSSKMILVNYGESYSFEVRTQDGVLVDQLDTVINNRINKNIFNVGQGGLFMKSTSGRDDVVSSELVGMSRWFHADADYVLKGREDQLSDWGTSINSYDPDRFFLVNDASFNDAHFKTMVMNHVKYDDPGTDFIGDWLGYAANYDSTLSFAHERLTRNPNDVPTVRFLMDYSTAKVKADICDMVHENFMKNNEDENWFYLNTRCMEAGPKQDSLFAQGFAQWPDNGWLALAVTFDHAKKGNWREAAEAAIIASDYHRQLETQFGVDFLRIIRIYNSENRQDPIINSIENSQLEYIRAIEHGDQRVLYYNTDGAYYHLSKGDKEQARSIATTMEAQFQLGFDYFLATSHSPDPELVRELKTWDQEKGITFTSIFTAVGFKIKHKLPWSELGNLVSNMWGDTDENTIERFFKKLEKRDSKGAQQVLEEIEDFRLVLQLQLVGVIVLEDNAPQTWKDHVKYGLYATEKPYLVLNES